jgi:hypothetical protein
VIDVKSHYRTLEWCGWHSNYSLGRADFHTSDGSPVILTGCRPFFFPVGYFRDSTTQGPLPFTLFAFHYSSMFRGFCVTNCLTSLLNCITHASCSGGRYFTRWVGDGLSCVRFTVHFEKVEVKFAIEQAMKIQRVRRGIALHFL